MHGAGHQRGRPMSEINVVPLVDVALVLLIIFMVTTAFVKEAGLNLRLPKAQTTEASPEMARDLCIAVDKKLNIYLEGKRMTLERLTEILNKRGKAYPNARVIIKADGIVAYRSVITILDRAKLAGFHNYALATEPEDIAKRVSSRVQ